MAMNHTTTQPDFTWVDQNNSVVEQKLTAEQIKDLNTTTIDWVKISVDTRKAVEWTKIPVVTITKLANADPFASSINFDAAEKAEQELTSSKHKLAKATELAIKHWKIVFANK